MVDLYQPQARRESGPPLRPAVPRVAIPRQIPLRPVLYGLGGIAFIALLPEAERQGYRRVAIPPPPPGGAGGEPGGPAGTRRRRPPRRRAPRAPRGSRRAPATPAAAGTGGRRGASHVPQEVQRRGTPPREIGGGWRSGGGSPPHATLAAMARILVTEKIADGGLQRLRDVGHVVDVRLGLTPDELIEVVPGAAALIIRSATQVDRAVLEAGTNLVVADIRDQQVRVAIEHERCEVLPVTVVGFFEVDLADTPAVRVDRVQ